MAGKEDDPEKHLKRLQNVFGTSDKIQKFYQKFRTPARLAQKESERTQAQKARELRRQRTNKVTDTHQHLLGLAAQLFQIKYDELLVGFLDSNNHFELLDAITTPKGENAAVIRYGSEIGYPLESGRFTHKNSRDKVLRMTCINPKNARFPGNFALFYKVQSAVVEPKSLTEDLFFIANSHGESQCIVSYVKEIFQVLTFKEQNHDFGYKSEQKWENLQSGLLNFYRFMASTAETLQKLPKFQVSGPLYKGLLLVPYQIKATSREKQTVRKVEDCFTKWMSDIQIVLSEGQEIVRDFPNDGPFKLLEYWRRMLANYKTVIDFVSSKPFVNHYTCLVLSRSTKLVELWKFLDNCITVRFNEANENTRYLMSLEQFWLPLYSSSPDIIKPAIATLLAAIRNICSTAHFFNSASNTGGLLVKITNQLTIALCNFLTSNGRFSIWQLAQEDAIDKIKTCRHLLDHYKEVVLKTMKDAQQAGEKPWACSVVYVFGYQEKFLRRLKKIKMLIDIQITYSVLKRIRIKGMEDYEEKIRESQEKIQAKYPNPLQYRIETFDKDFDIFLKEIEKVEIQMELFVKKKLEDAPTTSTAILLLKRFERLNLDCLCLDRRYLDVAVMLKEEIIFTKDVYNEKRKTPPICRNVPPLAGRLLWIRMLFRRVDESIQVLRTKPCVMGHEKAQLAIKYYNFIASIIFHYEMVHYKAWFDYVEEVWNYLNAPILSKNLKTNRLQLNLHIYVNEAIRETEIMWKLKLDVPNTLAVIGFCKQKIQDTVDMAKFVIRRNKNYRLSISPTFINVMKLQMKSVELAFQPGLTFITWLSENLDEYLESVNMALNEAIEFYTKIVTTQNVRILDVLDEIKEKTVVLPSKPVNPDLFIQEIENWKIQTGEDIERMSLAAERATVDLINSFVETVDYPAIDAKGRRVYMLPLEEINDKNFRYESQLPTDKWDWLCFEKINRMAWLQTEEGAVKLRFEEYENMKYELSDFHSDCMDIFSYFNNQMVSALAHCTKTSFEILKRRMDREAANTPLLATSCDFIRPNCVYNPSLEVMHTKFNTALQNIIDINAYVTTWGKQAKCESRMTRRITVHEVRHERNFYQIISEHKDVVRAYQNFSSGLHTYFPEMNRFINEFSATWKFLWANSRDEQIEEFVKHNPLMIEVKNKFEEYSNNRVNLKNSAKFGVVGPIYIDLDNALNSFIEQSMVWTQVLGKTIYVIYKKALDEMTDFITEMNTVLVKEIKDLDDVRIAMNAQRKVSENFIRMDMEFGNIVEMFQVLFTFEIYVPSDDHEKVDSLEFNFKTMILNSKKLSSNIMQASSMLLEQLQTGIAVFHEEVDAFNADFEAKGPMVEGIPAREAADRVFLFQGRFEKLWQKIEVINSGEKMFGLPITDSPIMNKRKTEFGFLVKLYSLYTVVLKSVDNYYEVPWLEVDIETITVELNDFRNRCRKLPKAMQSWPAFIDLKKKIDDFSETCPLLSLMANVAVKDRHWAKLDTVLGTSFDVTNPKFTLGKLLEAPILQYFEEVEDICVGAVKELDIEAKMKQIVTDWSAIELTLAPFKTRGDLLLKPQDIRDIITSIEDSIMILNSLATNRYNVYYKKDILSWLSKLVSTSEILEKWLVVQNLWMYLEAVFVSGDIAKQLPAEAKRFSIIDKSYVKIMQRAKEIPNVVECCTNDETVNTVLNFLIQQLELCQKSLTGYLELKRLIFPRFFFISDPVLLEILGQSSNPNSIQPHLLSIFDALATVDFESKTSDTIVGMNSANGEKVPLQKNVQCQGGVENWLGKLLKEMQETVKSILVEVAIAIGDPNFDCRLGFAKFCGQASILGIQILWTRDAEFALRKSKVDKFLMKQTNQKFLNILNQLIDMTVEDLTSLQRIRVETLVTIHVHQRDIFDEIFKSKVRDVIDFEWQKQARFYYKMDTDDILVGITDVNFIYQNEYLGVTERLAITPLTDRCYITLAQAMGLSMGGAPAGPAGTGKTETTKDMARALGKLVVVFNCSDQMDFRGLGRIYKGLAQSGSWGCFDEFNRIELPVLSVAAQQISIVLTARKEKKSFFIFSDGDVVSLNPEFGLFITMNPGYAGRQELPENLKMMFRSVAMMVPDRQIIMRVKLASCGFKENLVLSAKFYTLYKLCEEQLSKQIHYDFGLRNILSVLRTLGAQRRANPNDTEELIVMRVLRDMNVSKLIDEDEPLFLSLIDDMFPGKKLQQAVYKDLQKALSAAAKDLGYINNPEWNLKIVQLYEISLVRHGLMIMGPTSSGKSSCIETLLKSFTSMGRVHRQMRMNPKAITASQMFGILDATTNDWTDGIFSTLFRKTLKIKKEEFCWLVLDGPVDAVWIENLNSVLDDNKTLTLANGDRIKMSDNSKLVFEPDNVDNASPATVSRVGMVFMSSSVLGWRVLLRGWLLTRKSEADIIRVFFESVYEDAYTFLKTKLSAAMFLLEAIYMKQFLDILEGILPKENLTERKLERYFLFGMMWTLGAVLELAEREKLEAFLLKHPSKLKWPKLGPNESIFDYFVDETGNWLHWRNRVEEYTEPIDESTEFSKILVPNVDNVRVTYMMDIISKQQKSVLLIGEQGTAKTVMIKTYLTIYDKEVHLTKSLNFSSFTTPNMFQKIIESYVEKRVGTTYGPPSQRKMTIFIDDISMPVINEWGDQITNEIVRQNIEQGGFYALDKPGVFYTIVDIQFLAAMIHPGGGRNDIPNRLKSHFSVFNCSLPSNQSMDLIFARICELYFTETSFTPDVIALTQKLVPITRMFWQHVKGKMLPTPANFHYIFNLRDLSRIWQGILRIKGPECQKPSDLLKLWAHECTRVISDRLTTISDRDWFAARLNKDAALYLGEDAQHYQEEPTYFVDFLRDVPDVVEDTEDESAFDAPKIYEEIPSFEFVTNKVLFFMGQFNENIKAFKLDIVFFKDALVHLIIISRIIRTQRGSALLVGVGGSGKQSLTRLASFIAGYKFYQITLTRSYNISNFVDDLKYLFITSGLKGQPITFIFTDNEIKNEGFLEYLNNILITGEIAGLFEKDEITEMLGEITPIMKKVAPKRIPTQDNLYEFFISRTKMNLHVTLCFSPTGSQFRGRALKFPGLIAGCTIDWFQKWPEDARVAVSRNYLGSFDILCTDEVKESVIQIMSFVHENVSQCCDQYFEVFRRQVYVTPTSYISFLKNYNVFYTDKRLLIAELASRMSIGLDKLEEAAQVVELLKIDLQQKGKQIIKATEEANVVLEQVSKSTAAAEVVKEKVSQIKERAEVLVAQISKDKKIAEAKLEGAKPALEEAEAALRTIKAADIATVRKLGKPPYLITLVMDAVLILFRRKLEPVKPDYEKQFILPSWNESLKVMSDTRLLGKIVEYPKDSINAEMIDLLTPYFGYSQYTFEAAKIACGNVAGLLSWTMAMAKYYSINKDVLPLKANLAIQAKKYEKAANDLDQAAKLLQEKEDELAVVQRIFDEANQKKEAVLNEAQVCQDKMDTANALIDGLAGERTRWTNQLFQFKSETERLVGDAIMLTGFLSYVGAFNQKFRTDMLSMWFNECVSKKIPISANINITESFVDSGTITEWNVHGLPNDELSTQNGIIVCKAARYPLLIDPQIQGKTWIKSKEKANHLIVTQLTHKYFRTHLEDAVSLGYPILIEDIEEDLDPCLNNILEKILVKVGSLYKVKIGDKEVDFNDSFNLFMTTKLANPSYKPEVYARASIIDFTVTMRGLEDQLLARVIMKEKTELENERCKLIESVSANLKKMKELEANLLHKLSTVEGSLVEDVSVMIVLNISKKTVIEVQENLKIAKETEIKINQIREEFRPVATRGSVLYFLICTMCMVNPMYQTSLVQFLQHFDLSLSESKKSAVTFRRIQFIIEYLTFEMFRYKTRELYEAHKFIYVLLMALNIDMQAGNVSFDEFQTFIKGGAALDIKSAPTKPFRWISDVMWLNLAKLTSLRVFVKLLDHISANEKGWKNWYYKECPEDEVIPDGYNNLDPWKKLLLVRAWTLDRTIPQSRKYIAASLGTHFTEAVQLNFQQMIIESNPLTPILCFLSMGSDPTTNIEGLAKKSEIICNSMSMGQGQEIHARRLMAESYKVGNWVLLQNCHLGLEYMNELIGYLLELEKSRSSIHEQFRIWLTTEGHKSFPITLLQMTVKFTNEPPAGMRAGLEKTYGNMSQDFLDYSQHPCYHPLVFGISFMHTIVQERRKYGPLGWNIPYEFNAADWLSSCLFVQTHLDDADPKAGINWKAVRYMLGEVHYGGRVTDDYDKILLNTISRVWFNDKLFVENFFFFKDYPMMKFKIVEEYMEGIKLLPVQDPPQIYGFHPNADITYQTSFTRSILDTIISVQPKETTSGVSETREASVARQSHSMLSKLPPFYDAFEVKERIHAMGHLNPLNIFLKQEIERLQKVIVLVHITLTDLISAIGGTIVMSDALRDSLDSIYDARVPALWAKRSWASSTLGFWFTELIERNSQLSAWIYKGRPTVFWMSGFFNPQGFLTAMKQESARAQRGWSLELVSLQNDVTKYAKEECKKPPVKGIFIYGLFLEGAGWDRNNCKLVESAAKMLFTLMPVVNVYATLNPPPKTAYIYTCPVYKRARRTDLNLITTLQLFSSKISDHWTMRGVALLGDIS